MVQSEEVDRNSEVEIRSNKDLPSIQIDKNASRDDVNSMSSYEMAVHGDALGKQASSKTSLRKTLYGVIIVICSGISVCATTQFTKVSYDQENFTSTALANWLSRTGLTISYPVISMIFFCSGRSHYDTFKEAGLICGKDGFTLKGAAIRMLPLAFITAVSTYTYYYALTFTSSTDVTAVFSSAAGFVYILSIIWLKEPFVIFRFLAVIFSIGGVVLIAYSEGLGSFGAIGVLLAAASALISAVYRVVAKKYMVHPSVSQAALFASLLGIYSMLALWIPTVILHAVDVEPITIASFPWTLPLIVLFHVLYNLFLCIAIAITYPVYASLGPLLAIPLNAAIDVGYRQEVFNTYKILGTVFLVVGFLILTVPLPLMLTFSAKVRSLITFKPIKN